MCHMGNLSRYISVGLLLALVRDKGASDLESSWGVQKGELLRRQWKGSSRVIAKVSYPDVQETSISCNGTFYKWVWVRYIVLKVSLTITRNICS
jgi:hypothetical protein